jgi:alkylresorcinol/alkylpyrone synthase
MLAIDMAHRKELLELRATDRFQKTTRIASVAPILPANRYEQSELTAAFAQTCLVGDEHLALLRRFHKSAKVDSRYLALPLEEYAGLETFGNANDAFTRCALELSERAVLAALEAANLKPVDVDAIITTSTTGVVVPTIEARLISRLGLRPDVKRMPLFGLGCAGGAGGLARMHDYIRAWPGHVVVALSVELCSLTIQKSDHSVPNLVASSLFGDGAAAVVGVGGDRDRQDSWMGPEILATRSRLYPDSERLMGWDVGRDGFSIILSAGVPEIATRYLAEDVTAFLAAHELTIADIGTWVCHPGGPRVLEAMQEALDLPPDALELTWRSLARIGNLSSPSVIHVLADTLAIRDPEAGSYGVLLAFGPGFASELVLLRW